MKNNLPNPPVPIGNYVTLKTVDNYIYTSGHIPIKDDEPNKYIGKVGKEISEEEGYKAASLVCDLTISTILENKINTDKICPINVVGYINATDSFQNHANVLNGFTDRLSEHLPDAGLPTRSAVGVASLPKNVCVEIQTIFKIKENS